MPPTSQAPSSSRGNGEARARRTTTTTTTSTTSKQQQLPHDMIVEESDEEESEEADSESDSEQDESDQEESADEEIDPSSATRPTMHINRPQSYSDNNRRRPPPKPLNVNSNKNNSNRRPAKPTNSSVGGSSAPSYEDSAFSSRGADNYAYLPTPPSGHSRFSPSQPWTSPLSPPLPPPSVRSTARPRRPRTNTLPPAWEKQPQQQYSQSSAEDSSSSSATGPWRAMPPSSFTNPAARSSVANRPVPLKRSKTVREPAGAPVQAVVPRAPRTVAAARTRQLDAVGELYNDDDEDDDEEDDNDDGVRAHPGPSAYQDQVSQPQQKLPAGGKKAKLAVELKLNLEIEIELKAYIHGDVTLELFN